MPTKAKDCLEDLLIVIAKAQIAENWRRLTVKGRELSLGSSLMQGMKKYSPLFPPVITAAWITFE
jgi:hypothetical protein